jgi:hypothetical protein
MSGITEDDGQAIGRLLNAGAVLAGTIARLDTHEEINARLVDVETGQVLAATTIKAPLTFQEHSADTLEPENTPALFENRKELLKLRDDDPGAFRQVVRTVQEVDRIRNRTPGLFMLLTEPPDSKRGQVFAQRNHILYKRMQELRVRLNDVYRAAPSVEKVMDGERDAILKGPHRSFDTLE